MKVRCAMACAASVLLCASTASEAGFTLNYTVAPGSGSLAGKNVFSFYAKNDQTGPQVGSHTLLAMEIHFKTTNGQPFTFDFRDVDGDAKADANVFGKNFDEATPNTTFMRFGTYADWFGSVLAPGEHQTLFGGTPATTYTNVTDFYAIGLSQNQALDATQGIGRFFGAAVVPLGTDVTVTGLMGAEQGTGGGVGSAPLGLLAGPEVSAELAALEAAASVTAGPKVPVTLVARAPEPGATGMLGGVAAARLAARRRRR